MVFGVEYKKLEREARLGDKAAKSILEKRALELVKLPIREAFGYQLTWCPSDMPKEKLDNISRMYNMISITDNDVEVKLSEESFHSCRIEGADTTIEDTFEIFKAKRTNTKGEKMVLNTYRAVKYLNVTGKRDKDMLVRLWKIVTDGVCDNESIAGETFRTGDVRVGTHDAPEVSMLDYCIQQFFSFYNAQLDMSPYIKVAILHFYFVYMHPFCDGNGRIARLLTSDYLIRSGLNNFSAITLSKTLNERVTEYYEAIEASENSYFDVTPFILYFIDCVHENLSEVIS